MKIAILYSGGLDSKIMAQYAAVNYPDAEVVKIFFDIGQPYAHKERAALPPDVLIHKVDWLKDQAPVGKNGSSAGDIYVPGRNMTLACLAASITVPDRIWLGALLGESHERATDKNNTFLAHLNNTLSYVMSPFVEDCRAEFPLERDGMGKFEAVEWALKNGLTAQELIDTSSCLSGNGHKCGTCMVCARRWGIFYQLGLTESYDCTLTEMLNANEAYIKDLVNGVYHKARQREILPALMAVAVDNLAQGRLGGTGTWAMDWAESMIPV